MGRNWDFVARPAFSAQSARAEVICIATKGKQLIRPESIFVVLPVHNRKDLTLRCLRVLFEQRVRGFRVIVVDSGSTDGTADAVEAEFPHANVLRHSNLLWSGATNRGVERALAEGAEYILTLNDDIELAEGYLEAMMRAADRHPRALMGSYVFDIATQQPVFCGDRVRWVLGRTEGLLQTVPPEQRKGLLKVPFLPARGLWIPAEAFRKLGLFDAHRLPHYCADQDFTARAAANGFEVAVNCDAVLYCHSELSGGVQIKKRYNLENYRKHLFGKLGGGNLQYFTTLAFRHCPLRYLPLFWLAGCLRRIVGYPRDWAVLELASLFSRKKENSR